MKRWNTGWNDYWYTASLILDETPILLVFLDWIMDWLCHLIYFIPWIGERFHIYVHDPIWQFIGKHTNSTWIPLPYKFVQDIFPKEYKESEKSEWDNPKDTDLIKENKARMMQIYNQFMITHKWLSKHELVFENKREKEKENAS
jgi:hypothetical protein